MTDIFGCVECGERRRDIRALLGKARHEQWAGRPVEGLRERVAVLRRDIADCTAQGHLVTAPIRRRA